MATLTIEVDYMTTESEVAFQLSCHVTELMERGYRINNINEGRRFSSPYMEYFVIIEFEDVLDEMRYQLEYGHL